MSLSRRSMLSGGLGAVGASLLSRPDSARAQTPRAAKNVILLFVYGGWDVTVVFDPKPGLSTIDVLPGDIATIGTLPIYDHASRPATRAFFEAHGALATVINGISVQSVNHPDCGKRILTGTASEANPDFAAIAAYELGQELPAPYLVLAPTAYSGPLASIVARTGTATQLRGLLNPKAGFPAFDPRAVPFEPSAAEASLIDAYTRGRAEALRTTVAHAGYNAKRVDDYLRSIDRGDALRPFSSAFGSELSFSLDINVQIDIALRAIQEGVSHSVHIGQAISNWDTHSQNAMQGPQFEELMAPLKRLADELVARPGKTAGSRLIDDTVVVVMSEMSRTPKLNAQQGKDHWPVTSALLLGGGLVGGRVLGATGSGLEALPIDLATGATAESGAVLQYSNLAAGLLSAVGVDGSQYLSNARSFDALVA